MAFAYNSITEVLNLWADMGVFAYVIPFLLIFAVVFAILQKSNILGDNRSVQAIVAAAIGLLSLQFDFVSTFYATIFPRFGVGLAVFLVVVILIGFFYSGNKESSLQWIGWVTGIGVVIWALVNWQTWGIGTGGFELGWWIEEYFWPLIVLGVIIAVLVVVGKSGRAPEPKQGD